MRSFIVACAILTAVCIMIGINTAYVTSHTDKLLSVCELLKEDSSAARIDELVSEWQSCRDIIALSIHRSDLEQAENAVVAIQRYRTASEDFNYHLLLLINTIQNIKDEQKFSPGSIF